MHHSDAVGIPFYIYKLLYYYYPLLSLVYGMWRGKEDYYGKLSRLELYYGRNHNYGI